MPLKISKKFYLIPVVYISIIFFLIFLQLTSAKSFSEYYSSVEVYGTQRSGAKDYSGSMLSLNLEAAGIVFSFSKELAPEIVTADQNRTSLKLLGFRDRPSGIDILFSGNIIFKVTAGERKSQTGSSEILRSEILRIEPVFPYPEGSVREVSIFFNVSRQENLIPAASLPLAGYSSGTGTGNFFITSGSNSTLDISSSIIKLAPDSRGGFHVSVTEAVMDYSDPYTFWIENFLDTEITENDIKLKQDFLDSAYRVWRIDRFDRTGGLWTDNNNEPVYSREIISALGSELFRRNEFSLNQWIYNLAGTRNPDSLFLEFGLVNGNIINSFRNFQEEDFFIIENISSMIQNRDIKLFKETGLVSVITDRGPYSLISDILQFADVLTGEIPDIGTALGTASVYLDYAILNPDDRLSLEKFNSLVNKSILPQIINTDQGIFIAENSVINTFYTLEASKILRTGGSASGRKILQNLGDKLLYSVLSLSDSSGSIPLSARALNFSPAGFEGVVLPEYIYPYLESSVYLPRIKSLKNVLSPGTWLASCAEIIKADLSGRDSLVYSSLFPEGSTEYIVFQGIPSVSGLNIYGRVWAGDPQFERYYTGWHYLSDSQTLFVKLLHNSPEETIIINF